MTVRVLALVRYDRMGASSRLRFLQYQPSLAALGVSVEAVSFFDDEYLRQRYAGNRRFMARLHVWYLRRLHSLGELQRYDVIWLEKELLPWLPAVLEMPALRRRPYVVDFDDAWHLRYDESPNPLVRLVLAGKFDQIVRNAESVIVGNRNLEQWAAQAGARNIALIPTVVDIAKYPVTPFPRARPYTLGWIGSFHTAPYLQRIAHHLARVCDGRQARLLVIGPDRMSLPGVAMDAVPWSEATEAEMLQRIHVGLNPLPDGTWERSKSAFKIIQYMACARPVISSSVGGCRDIVTDGKNGLLVENDEDWPATIARLRNDPALARRLGKAGRRMVENEYSLQHQVAKLASILADAAGRSRNSGTGN